MGGGRGLLGGGLVKWSIIVMYVHPCRCTYWRYLKNSAKENVFPDFLQRASDETNGGMASVVGLKLDVVEELCVASAKESGKVKLIHNNI